MTKVLITESYLDGIGDGIRYANGGSDTYKPSQMEAAIRALKPNLQSKTATQNGTVTPDSGYNGLSQVVVNVSGGTTSENIVLLHFNGDRVNSGFYGGRIDSNAELASGGKFGSGCLQTGSVPAMHGMFDLAANDFTLDFWIKSLGTHSSRAPVISFKYRMLGIYVGAASIGFSVAKSASSWSIDKTINAPSGISFDDGEWHHIAACRDGATIRVFADGLVADEMTFGAGEAIVTPSDDTGIYFFKNQGAASPMTATNWQMDEFRLLIGQAAWTAAFTPPTEPYA